VVGRVKGRALTKMNPAEKKKEDVAISTPRP